MKFGFFFAPPPPAPTPVAAAADDDADDEVDAFDGELLLTVEAADDIWHFLSLILKETTPQQLINLMANLTGIFSVTCIST